MSDAAAGRPWQCCLFAAALTERLDHQRSAAHPPLSCPGAFGWVQHARNRQTGEEVAVKFITLGPRFYHKCERDLPCAIFLGGWEGAAAEHRRRDEAQSCRNRQVSSMLRPLLSMLLAATF